MTFKQWPKWVCLALFAVAIIGCKDPGSPDIAPTYKWPEKGEPAKGTSGERGSMLINEIGFAGSVTDAGVWDNEDVFIELWNKHARPINVTGWRVEVSGDFNYGFKIPPPPEGKTNTIPPNGFFLIAAKKDGAYGHVADVIVPELRFGNHLVAIELRDIDRKLMEDAGSDRERVFAGGYDTWTVRSMERAQVIFGNRGGQARNWHAYSRDVGSQNVKDGYKANTLASPRLPNSSDYSGNASSGNFE